MHAINILRFATHRQRRILFALLVLCLAPAQADALSILSYNVAGIQASGSEPREALQRIVSYFDPDIIIFQEARGTQYPNGFLASNPDYEGFYSSPDGASNRLMIMSKHPIIPSSMREYQLGEGSLRPMFELKIDLPGPHILAVFTAHWNASSAEVRENESAESVHVLQEFRTENPSTLYLYAGDFNVTDDSPLISALMEPATGLTMFTPVCPITGSSATINSRYWVVTYLDRRIDYILPSTELAAFGISGRILNTWEYAPQQSPPGLEQTDTVNASDHLPVYMHVRWRPIPGDANFDCRVNILDLIFIRNKLNQDVATGDNWKGDVNGDSRINILDLIFVRNKLNTSCP